MTRTYTETITLEQITCSECGMTFAVPQHWLNSKRSSGDAFSCPNRHGQMYQKTTEMKLQEARQQLAEAEAQRSRLAAQLVSTIDQLQATERELKRHKTRTANGVCPCCNRSFVKLAQHMKTRHPEYASTPSSVKTQPLSPARQQRLGELREKHTK